MRFKRPSHGMTSSLSRLAPAATITGRLSRFVPVAPETILYGRLTDAQLHGLLALCQDLGLQVVAIREAPSTAIAAIGRPLNAPSPGPS